MVAGATLKLGVGDGVSVGVAVSVGVGVSVGVAVSVGVGVSVGEMVGVSVGATVAGAVQSSGSQQLDVQMGSQEQMKPAIAVRVDGVRICSVRSATTARR
jgi:hypothetical protein